MNLYGSEDKTEQVEFSQKQTKKTSRSEIQLSC